MPNTTTTPAGRDKALTTINLFVWLFLLAAAAISFTHIVQTGYHLGLGRQSWLAPMFIDGIAIVGKLSMLARFTPAFRRSGFRLLMLGGILSLAANVYAGNNLGTRAFGVLVVAGFMALENHASKATRTAAIPAPVVIVEDLPVPAAPTYRSPDAAELAARTAARPAYAKRSPAGKAAWTRAYRAKVDALAPTSPGMAPVSAPSVATLELAAA